MLAGKLETYAGRPDVVVLGLPRGGIPVAFEVARKIRVPLHAFLVRKLGAPRHEELALGAIASGGICVMNEEIVRSLGVPRQIIDEVMAREQDELARLEEECGASPLPDLRGRTVIIIDDGLATGASMRAAVMAVRQRQPARIIVAVPVASKETAAAFLDWADDVVCVQTPGNFAGVGQWYCDFSQTSSAEVREFLAGPTINTH